MKTWTWKASAASSASAKKNVFDGRLRRRRRRGRGADIAVGRRAPRTREHALDADQPAGHEREGDARQRERDARIDAAQLQAEVRRDRIGDAEAEQRQADEERPARRGDVLADQRERRRAQRRRGHRPDHDQRDEEHRRTGRRDQRQGEKRKRTETIVAPSTQAPIRPTTRATRSAATPAA